MQKEISILIADDHPVFRRGLRQVIEAEPDMRVVVEAEHGEAALEGIRRAAPDLAVLDIGMPRLTGLVVARQAAGANLRTRFLFLTMHEDPAIFEQAMALGAGGYVLKDAALSEIVQASRVVSSGRTFVSPALSEYLVARAFPARRGPAAATGAVAMLTDRERQVLRLIAASQTSKEIAGVLRVHYRTVENLRTAISQKLGLQGSHALVKFAFDHRDQF